MGHYANLTFKVKMFLEVVFGKMLHYPNVCIFSLFLYIFLFDFMVYVCVCVCVHVEVVGGMIIRLGIRFLSDTLQTMLITVLIYNNDSGRCHSLYLLLLFETLLL